MVVMDTKWPHQFTKATKWLLLNSYKKNYEVKTKKKIRFKICGMRKVSLLTPQYFPPSDLTNDFL